MIEGFFELHSLSYGTKERQKADLKEQFFNQYGKVKMSSLSEY